jgi:hypothetical protein
MSRLKKKCEDCVKMGEDYQMMKSEDCRMIGKNESKQIKIEKSQ